MLIILAMLASCASAQQYYGNYTLATGGRPFDATSCQTLIGLLSSASQFAKVSLPPGPACTILLNPYPSRPSVTSILMLQYSFANYNAFSLMWSEIGSAIGIVQPGGSATPVATSIWRTVLAVLSLGCDTEARYSDSLRNAQGSSATQPVTTFLCSNLNSQQTQLLDPGSTCDFNVQIACTPPPPYIASPPPPSPSPPAPVASSLFIKFSTSSQSGPLDCSALVKAVSSVLMDHFTSLSTSGANWLPRSPTCVAAELANMWTVTAVILGAPLAIESTDYLTSKGLSKLMKSAALPCDASQINLIFQPNVFVSASCSVDYPDLCCSPPSPPSPPKSNKKSPPPLRSPPPKPPAPPTPPSPISSSLLLRFSTTSSAGFDCSVLIGAINSTLVNYYKNISPTVGISWLLQLPTCSISVVDKLKPETGVITPTNVWTVTAMINGSPLAVRTFNYLAGKVGLANLVQTAAIPCGTSQVNLIFQPSNFISASCSSEYPSLCCSPPPPPGKKKSPPPPPPKKKTP